MKIKLKHHKYGIGQEVKVVVATYYEKPKRPAIILYDTDGSVFSIASKNTDDPINEDEVLIKNYSENEGVIEDLIENKIISKPVRWVGVGYVRLAVCKLLIKPDEN